MVLIRVSVNVGPVRAMEMSIEAATMKLAGGGRRQSAAGTSCAIFRLPSLCPHSKHSRPDKVAYAFSSPGQREDGKGERPTWHPLGQDVEIDALHAHRGVL